MQLMIGVLSAVVVVIVVVVLLLIEGSGSGTQNVQGVTTPTALQAGGTLLPVGTKAPNFDLATIDGKHYTLSGLHGSPVLLEYFAVWCPHCQHEAPILNQIYSDFTPKGLKIVSILASPYGPNYDTSGATDLTPATKADVANFIKTYQVQQPVLIDPSFADVNVMGVGGYPTMYILDKSGVIRWNSGANVPDYSQIADGLQQVGLSTS
jgi:peroxiredoxin